MRVASQIFDLRGEHRIYGGWRQHREDDDDVDSDSGVEEEEGEGGAQYEDRELSVDELRKKREVEAAAAMRKRAPGGKRPGSGRKSSGSGEEDEEEEDDDERRDGFDAKGRPIVPRNAERFLVGQPAGIRSGYVFVSSKALRRTGVHRGGHRVVSGSSSRGAFSLLLSEYAILVGADEGSAFTYAELVEDGAEGSSGGGRDGARQWLQVSFERRQPVRVVRSSRLAGSRYSPPSGYRYDGLYVVAGHSLQAAEEGGDGRDDGGDGQRVHHTFRLEMMTRGGGGAKMADGTRPGGGRGPWDCQQQVTVSRRKARRRVEVLSDAQDDDGTWSGCGAAAGPGARAGRSQNGRRGGGDGEGGGVGGGGHGGRRGGGAADAHASDRRRPSVRPSAKPARKLNLLRILERQRRLVASALGGADRATRGFAGRKRHWSFNSRRDDDDAVIEEVETSEDEGAGEDHDTESDSRRDGDGGRGVEMAKAATAGPDAAPDTPPDAGAADAQGGSRALAVAPKVSVNVLRRSLRVEALPAYRHAAAHWLCHLCCDAVDLAASSAVTADVTADEGSRTDASSDAEDVLSSKLTHGVAGGARCAKCPRVFCRVCLETLAGAYPRQRPQQGEPSDDAGAADARADCGTSSSVLDAGADLLTETAIVRHRQDQLTTFLRDVPLRWVCLVCSQRCPCCRPAPPASSRPPPADFIDRCHAGAGWPSLESTGREDPTGSGSSATSSVLSGGVPGVAATIAQSAGTAPFGHEQRGRRQQRLPWPEVVAEQPTFFGVGSERLRCPLPKKRPARQVIGRPRGMASRSDGRRVGMLTLEALFSRQREARRPEGGRDRVHAGARRRTLYEIDGDGADDAEEEEEGICSASGSPSRSPSPQPSPHKRRRFQSAPQRIRAAATAQPPKPRAMPPPDLSPVPLPPMPLPTGLRLAPLGYSSADRQDSHATHDAAHDAAADLAAAFAAARAACPGLLSASVPLDASLPSRLPSLISRLVTSLCALQAAGEEALRAGVSALPPLCDDWVAQCEAFPRALDATLAMTCHLWTGEAAGRLAAALVQADEYMRRSWAWSAEQVACLATPEQGSGGAGGGEVAIYPEASSAARRVVHMGAMTHLRMRALTVDWLRTLDDRNGGGCRPALMLLAQDLLAPL